MSDALFWIGVSCLGCTAGACFALAALSPWLRRSW